MTKQYRLIFLLLIILLTLCSCTKVSFPEAEPFPTPVVVYELLDSPAHSRSDEANPSYDNLRPSILLEVIDVNSVPGEDPTLATIFLCQEPDTCHPIIRYRYEKMYGFHLAPSGSHLIVDLRMPDSSVQLYLINLQTAEFTQLTNSAHIHYILGWRENGSGFLVNRISLDNPDLRKEPDTMFEYDLNTLIGHRILENCNEFVHAYYSKDAILFSATCDGQQGIFRLTLANGNISLLVETNRPQFVLSPNGEEVAFNRQEKMELAELLSIT